MEEESKVAETKVNRDIITNDKLWKAIMLIPSFLIIFMLITLLIYLPRVPEDAKMNLASEQYKTGNFTVYDGLNYSTFNFQTTCISYVNQLIEQQRYLDYLNKTQGTQQNGP